MFAVIETGGKQHMVGEGSIIDVEKLDGNESSTHTFDKVLLISDGKNVQIGQPYLAGATVSADVVSHFRDDKQIVFKFKSKTGYKKKQGHRQSLTTVRIQSISGKSSASSKKASAKKTEAATEA